VRGALSPSFVMKNILILGGTSGIGKSLARLLVQKGFNVFIAGRSVDKIHDFKNKLKLDVRDEQCSKILKEFLTKNNIDAFLYSSGVGYVNQNLELGKELSATEVNVVGFTRCINVAFHYLSSRNENTLLGAISSVAGVRGLRHAPA
jgi:short-subunit dehydrogenase